MEAIILNPFFMRTLIAILVLTIHPAHGDGTAASEAAVTPREAELEAERHYARGNEFANAGRTEEAILSYTQAVAKNPRHARAIYNRGAAYLQQKRYDLATEAADTLLRLVAPGDPPYLLTGAHFIRGIARLESGQPEPAIEDLGRVISLDPGVVEAYIRRAQALETLGRGAEAAEDRARASELAKSDPLPSYNEGSALIAAGRHREAVDALTRAIERKPDFAQAYVNRGVAYERLGETEKARADQSKARELLEHGDDK